MSFHPFAFSLIYISDSFSIAFFSSAFLRISISKLEGLMREKQIPFYRINRRVIFYKEDILKWLANHKVK